MNRVFAALAIAVMVAAGGLAAAFTVASDDPAPTFDPLKPGTATSTDSAQVHLSYAEIFQGCEECEQWFLHQDASNDILTLLDPSGEEVPCVTAPGSVNLLDIAEQDLTLFFENEFINRTDEFPFTDAEPSGILEALAACLGVPLVDIQDLLDSLELPLLDATPTHSYPNLVDTSDGAPVGAEVHGTLFTTYLLPEVPEVPMILDGQVVAHVELFAEDVLVGSADVTGTSQALVFGVLDGTLPLPILDEHWNAFEFDFLLDGPIAPGADLTFTVEMTLVDNLQAGSLHFVGYNGDHASNFQITLPPGDIRIEKSIDEDTDEVPDGPLAGITFFMDLNGNGLLDAGPPAEPSAVTAADGTATIQGIPAGVYTLCEVLPAHLMVFSHTVCFDVTVVAGATGTSAQLHQVVNQYVPADISGSKCEDLDADALCGEEEPPFPGVTIYLDGTNGHPQDGVFQAGGPADGEINVTTDANGDWAFLGLPGGNYVVREVVPVSYIQTAPALPDEFVVQLQGVDVTGLGFANHFVPGDIRINKQIDSDTDGTPDDGLGGIVFFVDLNGDGVLDAGEPSDTTDSDGDALITGLAQGTYSLCEVLPANIMTGPGETLCRDVGVVSGVTGNNAPLQEFLNQYVPADISGHKCEDLGGDGSCDGDDPDFPGVTIYLDGSNQHPLDGAFQAGGPGDGEVNVTTDENGNWAFEDLPGGTYVVREVVPNSFAQTAPAGPDEFVVVLEGEDVVLEFANHFVPGDIRIEKTVDADSDGDGDVPVESITFFIDLNDDQSFDNDEPFAATDSGGNALITGLAEGTYSLCEILPEHLIPSDDEALCRDVDVVSGVTGNDAPLQQIVNQYAPADIFGFKCIDIDGDGVCADDEDGLAGVTIYLDGSNGQPLDGVFQPQEDNVVTSSGGNWEFTDLPGGTYVVREVVPENFVQTAPTNPDQFVVQLQGVDVELEFADQPIVGDIRIFKCLDIDADGLCDKDLITGPEPDALFIVDVSRSTRDTQFVGDTTVGDVNGDGFADSMLDAEILAFQSLAEQLRARNTDAKVSIVVFATSAATMDMDPGTSGIQLSISVSEPGASSPFLVDEVLASIQQGEGGTSVNTNYRDALEEALSVVEAVGSFQENRNVIMLTDGKPNIPSGLTSSYASQADALRDAVGNLRAFGAGDLAELPPLLAIDPNAEVFTDPDALQLLFSGAAPAVPDPGMEGIVFFVDLNDDGQHNTGEPQATTDSDGIALITDVPAGLRTVCEVLPAGFVSTLSGPDPLCQTVNVIAGDTAEAAPLLEFSNAYRPASISGFKCEDLGAITGHPDAEFGRCDGSITRGQMFHVIYTVDLSSSTDEPWPHPEIFDDDVNGDGAVTILDAQLAALIATTQRLVEEGHQAQVGIVVFAQHAAHVDMSAHPGLQHFVSVEEAQAVLESIKYGDFDIGLEGTNYTRALQASLDKIVFIPVVNPDLRAVFVSDGFPNLPDDQVSSYQSEADAYQAATSSVQAFGAGSGSDLSKLHPIDDGNAASFTDPATVADTAVVVPAIEIGGDPPLAGVVIYLDLNNNGVLDAGEPSTTTDADGKWSFDGLLPNIPDGQTQPQPYIVREVVPDGYVQTAPSTGHHSVLLVGLDVMGLEFANREGQTAGISGIKCLVVEGAQDCSGGTGLAGVTIFLDSNENGLLDGGETSTVTDAEGAFAFEGLDPGQDVQVCEVVPLDSVSNNGACRTVSLQEGVVAQVDFANELLPTGTVSGFKCEDENEDGLCVETVSGDEPPQMVFVIDVSGSTTEFEFIGSEPVGDFNNDGFSNTVLDAELFAFQELVNALIVAGFGDSAEIGIVVFGTEADVLDMNGAAAGSPLVAAPDDVEPILRGVEGRFGGEGLTNFEDALAVTISLVNAAGFGDMGEVSVFFLSDGSPTRSNTNVGPDSSTTVYEDEVADLVPLVDVLRAFGVGAGAAEGPLQVIDPDAEVFTDPDELFLEFQNQGQQTIVDEGVSGVQIFADLNENGVFEPGLGEPGDLTDSQGLYSFEVPVHPQGGTRPICEVVPPGYQRSAPVGGDCYDIQVTDGGDHDVPDFANIFVGLECPAFHPYDADEDFLISALELAQTRAGFLQGDPDATPLVLAHARAAFLLSEPLDDLFPDHYRDPASCA